MRVLLLVDTYLPSTRSGAKHMYDLAVEIRRLGHTPVVATIDAALDARSRVTVEDGITVLRVRTGPIKEVSRVVRAVNEWRLPSTIWRAGREFFRAHPCDLIVFYSPTIFFGPLVRRLKRLWGCPSYLILRDIFPQWAVDAGVLRRGSLPHRLFRRKELEQYAAADTIAVQSPANLRYFEEHGLARGLRLEVLYNWTPVTGESVPATTFRSDLGLAGKVVFFYGGNLGVAQDIDNLVRLAEGLRDEPALHVLVAGAGSEAERLARRIAETGVRNLTLIPPVDQRTYLGLVSEIDVGVITLDRRLKTQNFPGKMLGYMYFGKPILASINPENDLQELIEKHEAGIVLLNGEDAAFKDAALRLGRDAALRERLGQNGRRLLETTFDVARAAERILGWARPGPD